MSAIAVTVARVAPVFPNSPSTIVRSHTSLEAITAGQAVYLDPTTGKVGLCDGNASGKKQFYGIALYSHGADEAIQIQTDGEIYGFTLTGDYGAIIYVGDTAGVLDTATGTTAIQVGKIVPLNDADRTKVLYISRDKIRDWS